MSAYIVVDTKISDAEKYEEYKRLAKPIAEKHGGVYKARGGELEVFESDLWTPTRLVIVEFPSMDAARAFLNDPEYAPVRDIRRGNAVCTLALIDGA